MTLRCRNLSLLPADTAALGERLLASDNPYRELGERLAELVQDEQFAALYQDRGRAAISPALLALVTIFQFREGLPDRQAAEAVVVRLDWKYALHQPLAFAGFDFSDLCAFRQRLVAHQATALVFDLLLEQVRALGFVRARGQQRTDATAVLGAVKALSRLELVWETLRLALGALEAAVPGWVAREVPASVREQYAVRRSDYRLTAAERQAVVVQVGQDGCWLLDRLAASPPAGGADLAAVVTLRLVWAQQFERTDDRVTPRADPVPATERLVTPHDTGVRAGEKRGQGWLGDKTHVTERAEAHQPHFVTDVTTTSASSGDAQALPQIRDRLAERDLLPREQYVDAGYVTGPQLAQSADAEIDLVGPPLPDTSPQEFKLADFQIDRAAKQAVCPVGQPSVKGSERTDRDGTRAVNIQFARVVCAGCPLRPRCTDSASGRSLHVREQYELVHARRVLAQTPAYQQRLHLRAGVEGTISELVRRYGLRQHRYRGEIQRHLENLLKGAACNLFRLLRVLATSRRPQPVALS